jgi:hypothetical protein
VHNAVLKTLEDGTARDVFWVTDREGRKVGAAHICNPPVLGSLWFLVSRRLNLMQSLHQLNFPHIAEKLNTKPGAVKPIVLH